MKNVILPFVLAIGIHAQRLPLGIVVGMPATDAAGIGTPLQTTYTVLLTHDLPEGGQLSATAVLATGQLGLWSGAIKPPMFFVQERCGGARPLLSCTNDLRNAGPDDYVLPGGIKFLPVGISVSATITPTGGEPFQVATGSFVQGIQQSADLLTITIGGKFDPSVQTNVYFGLWPQAVRTEAFTVAPDHITINLTQDVITFTRFSGWYAVTVLQGNTCDSAMLQYHSAMMPRFFCLTSTASGTCPPEIGAPIRQFR